MCEKFYPQWKLYYCEESTLCEYFYLNENYTIVKNLHCMNNFVLPKKLHYCENYTIWSHTVRGIAVCKNFVKSYFQLTLFADTIRQEL